MGNIDNWAVRVGLFGESSSASFMQYISKILEGGKTPDPDLKARGIASGHAATRPFYRISNKSRTGHSTEYVLPPRKAADHLLEIHWSCSQIILPWLDRVRFMKQYETLWTSDPHSDLFLDDQVFYCILNIIFALSYKIDPTIDSEQQDTLSTAHFARAQRLLSFNLLEISHIGMVQALLLMAQYLQSTNMPRQCFQCVSLAIWIAQDVGLNMPESVLPFQNQHEREVARRVWHGCILMDRVTAMSFGRPMRVSQESAKMSPLPSPIDDEFLDDSGLREGVQPTGQPSQLQFFVAYCELHLILGDILSVFYTGRVQPGNSVPEDPGHRDVWLGNEHVDKVLQFEKTLNMWRAKLEPYHDVDPNFHHQHTPLVFRRQAISLQARFLHIRMLLYRPFFAKLQAASRVFTNPPAFSQQPQLADSISFHGLVSCVLAAKELIGLISTHLNSQETAVLLPPWWHVISYIYTAGTVVIAAHLVTSVVDHISFSTMSTSVSQAVASLEYFESQDGKYARLRKSALEHLHEKALSSRARKHSPEGAVGIPHADEQPGSTAVGLPADYFQHEGALDFYDGIEFLWLNSAPFNSDTNFWL